MNTLRTMVGGAAAAVLAGLLVPMAGGASAQPGPLECGNADVKASFVTTGAGMSHTFGSLRLRNVSDAACWVQGYGGLSYVGHGDGTQIGAAAGRTQSTHPRVVLQPGQRAVSAVSMTGLGPYSRRQCRPAKADGFRVYVPDATVSQFVRHPMRVCANPRLHTLTHKAYHHA